MVVLTCAVMGVIAFAATALFLGLGELRDRDLRRAELQAEDLALAASLTVRNTIDKIDVSLRTIADELERHSVAGAELPAVVHAVVTRQFDLLAESEDVTITDAEGLARFHQGPERPEAFSVADRDYFRALADGAKGLVISRPLLSRVTGRPVLVFARAYRTPEGAFGGAVVIPVQIGHIRVMISGYRALAPRDRLSLMMDDLTPVATVPDDDEPASPELRAILKMGPLATTFHEVIEGEARLVAIRRLNGTAIYAICAIAERDYLADWRELRTAAFVAFAAFLAFVIGGARALYAAWIRQRRHALDLSASNARLAAALRKVRALDTALEAARDVGGLGTFSLDLASGVWTPSPEQQAIFGLAADYPHTRAGWDALFHPDDLPVVYAYFEERRAHGDTFFDHEYRIVRPSDGTLRWIHGVGRIDRDETGRATQFIGAVKDITDAKLRRDRIEYLALHDALTDLPNRTLLADRMRQALEARRDDLIAICYLDLDGFKPVNDRWGHQAGDAVLVELAHRLAAAARAGDTVARLGGDEFVVLLCGVAGDAEIATIARRLLDAIGGPCAIGNDTVTLSASIGVAVHPRGPGIDPDALIRQADQAMYEAKRRGRNRFHVFDRERDRQVSEGQAHLTRIAAALEAREFRLHFQPRVDLANGRVDGLEALIRWQHPERGLLPPAAFLSGIEDSELAVPLGEWVLREALRHRLAWRDAGLDLTVAVNLFGRHLQHPDFVARLSAILGEFPSLPPKGLELEIVETTVMLDLAAAARRMLDCTRLGVRFALDDFGTGYASLTYFRRLPVSLLKIDRSFVADILDDPGDQALVQSVVAMARTFGCATVAEGVETLAHGLPLMRYGCDFAQGYGIAEPMPAEAVAAWVAGWRMPDVWRAQTAGAAD